MAQRAVDQTYPRESTGSVQISEALEEASVSLQARGTNACLIAYASQDYGCVYAAEAK